MHTPFFTFIKSHNPFRLSALTLIPCFFCFTLSSFGQVSVKDVKNAPSATDPAKAPTEKKDESKPLKMETGTVTVDPQIVSADYKRNNLRHLKKLKSSFLNYDAEPKFSTIMKNYVDASIKFQEKNYITSRRIFEQNYIDLNTEAQAFSKKYADTYNKL